MKCLMLPACLFFVFFINSCTAEESPKVVVEKFFEAIQKDDTSMLLKYATPEFYENSQGRGNRRDSYSDIRLEVARFGKITVTSEEIDGNTATVYIEDEGGRQEYIKLEKINGEWKADLY